MSDVIAPEASDLDRMLLKAWQGEVYGVEVYGAFAERRVVPEESAKLRELVALEERMEALLSDVLDRRGIAAELDDVMAVADQDIRDQARSSWLALMEWLERDAAVALGEYEPMLELARSGDEVTAQVVADVVAHERALVSFCAKERVGAPDSLADVRALLAGR